MGKERATTDGTQIPRSEDYWGEGDRGGLVDWRNARNILNLVFSSKGHQTTRRYLSLLLSYELSCGMYEISLFICPLCHDFGLTNS